jgi:hypothetical protein
MGGGMMGGAAQSQTVAAALGISVDDLVRARQAGKSVATLAQEKGVTLDKVVEAAMAPHKATMAARVSAGYMTQAQTDWMLAEMETNLREQFVDPQTAGPGYGGMGNYFGVGLLGQSAQALGLTRGALLGELRAGKSVAALAQEKGVDVQKAIVDPLLAREQAQLQERVKAGALTQANADAIQAQVAAQVQERIQSSGIDGYSFGNPATRDSYGPGMMGGGYGSGMMGGGYGYGPMPGYGPRGPVAP